MIAKERVLATIRHEVPDRVPLSIWADVMRSDVQEMVLAKYPSLDSFYDALDLDVRCVMISGPCYGDPCAYEEVMEQPFPDPADCQRLAGIRHVVRQYGNEKAIFTLFPGVVEATQAFLGIENLLLHMALDRDAMGQLFLRVGHWLTAQAEALIDVGVDVLYMHDDWGQNERLLFSPKDWWQLVFPADQLVGKLATSRDIPLGLHSDGNIQDVLNGVLELGISILHPVQESAGMDQLQIKREYGDRLCLYGGLDITHTLPHASQVELVEEIRRKMKELKPAGGWIFSTAHTIQPDTTIDRVELAYRTALECANY